MAALGVPAVELLRVVDTMRRGRLAEYAYDYTKRMLFDGTLGPGAKLRVEDVVGSLHTSRQPVMDAFKRLASEGYLEITPQVGCRVVVPDASEIADFFLILGAIQGLAADIAAERKSGDELAHLADIVAQIDAVLSAPINGGAAQVCRQLDHHFQQQIRTMAHSDSVAELASRLLDRRDFYILCITDGELRYADRMREVAGEYHVVVDAIAAGNAERARSRTESLVLTLGRLTLGTATATSGLTATHG